MKKKLLMFAMMIVVLASVACISVFAETVASGTCGADGDNLTWTLDDTGTLTISGEGAMKKWTSNTSVPWYSKRTSIKTVIIGDGVTSIGNMAFYGYTKLESITISDSVTSIGAKALSFCSSLENITIPNNVISIGLDAFQGCKSITSINIPASVSSIPSGVFNDCDSLESITVDEENVAYTSEDGMLFDYEKTTIIRYPSKKQGTSYEIPSSVTSIANGAFYNCTFLTNVTIPAGVTSIGTQVFAGCTSLELIVVDADNTAYVSEDGILFNYDKTTLIHYPAKKTGESYDIPSTVTSINAYAFEYCRLLTKITIPDGVTNISAYAFRGCTSLESINIPEKVTIIGQYAFYGCTSLESITIPDGVTNISTYAFYGCTLLESINIPVGVTSIGGYAFQNCRSLTSVTIPEGVEKIFASTFYGCNKLAKVTIPASVTNILSSAFYGCTRLEEIHFDGTEEEWNSVTKGANWDKNAGVNTENGTYTVTFKAEIIASGTCGDDLTWTLDEVGTLTISGTGAMTNWTSTKEIPWYEHRTAVNVVNIKDGVTSIGTLAFTNCSALTSVTMSDSVTSIGRRVFQNCRLLTSLTLSAGVTIIDYHSFSQSYLQSITVDEKNTAYTSQDGVLFNKDMTVLVRYPSYKEDEIYSVPESVREIGAYAFYECKCLVEVWLYDGVKNINNYAFYRCTSIKMIYIPNSNSVTNIGNRAFSGCTSLEYAWLPDSITNIGNYAFSDCTSLTWAAIIFGDTNVVNNIFANIGNYAFSGCTALENISIPNNVTNIGNNAFDGCTALYEIWFCGTEVRWNKITKGTDWDLNAGTATEKGKYELVFGNDPVYVVSGWCEDTLWWCIDIDTYELFISGTGEMENWTATSHAPWYDYAATIKSIRIDYANSIGNYAFYGCESLTSMTIPESVTSIGSYAFRACSSMTDITIGNSVESIGNLAFYGCESLTSMTIPESVTSIGRGVFNNCYSLESITVDGNNTAYTSEDGILFNKDKSSILCYPPNKAGDSYDIPVYVTSIGDYAFSGCSSMTDITIGNCVESIGSSAFSGCKSLTNVTIPESVTSIGRAVFSGCYSLESITVDGNNTAYTSEDGILFNKDKSSILCYPLNKAGDSYDIPVYVTSIGDYAFSGCNLLTSIKIHSDVTSIGDYAFSHCRSLTSMTIPNGIERINLRTFYDCRSLTYVIIPASVTMISYDAFLECRMLEEIRFRGTDEEWNSISKASTWDRFTGAGTEKGTYTVIYNYNLGELLSNLGASIRPESVEYSAGLRFGVSFKKSDFGIVGTYAYDGADITFGMLLIPERVVTNAGYEKVIDYYENYDGQVTLDVPAKKIYAQDDEMVTYTAVLLNIPESEYTSVICALPYAIVDGKYYFGNEMKTSFYGIASEARENTYSDEAIAAIVDEKKKAEAQAMADALDKIIAIVKVEG